MKHKQPYFLLFTVLLLILLGSFALATVDCELYPYLCGSQDDCTTTGCPVEGETCNHGTGICEPGDGCDNLGDGCTCGDGCGCPDGQFCANGCECTLEEINPCGEDPDSGSFARGEDCCRWVSAGNDPTCCLDCGSSCDTSDCIPPDLTCAEENAAFQSGCSPGETASLSCGVVSCNNEDDDTPCPSCTGDCMEQTGTFEPNCACESYAETPGDCEEQDGCGVKAEPCPSNPSAPSCNSAYPYCEGAATSSSFSDECGCKVITYGSCTDLHKTVDGTDNRPCACGYTTSSSTSGCTTTTSYTCKSPTSIIGTDERPCACGYITSTSTSDCVTTKHYICKSPSATTHSGPTSCSLCYDYSTTSGGTTCNPTTTGYCTFDATNDPSCSGGCSPHDDDNDGVDECGDDLCLGTPGGEAVNSDGCSCSQLTIGTHNCFDDKCGTESGTHIRDYYDYPVNVPNTCLNGIITAATDADCSNAVSVTPNDARCDSCVEDYGVNDGGIFNLFPCPASYCDVTPFYDGTDGSIGNYYTYDDCYSTCEVIGGVAIIVDQTTEMISNSYYDWDNCFGCTQPRCDDGVCGFRDADADYVCDDYDQCVVTGSFGEIFQTLNKDFDLNGYNENDEVILESCTNYDSLDNCPTYERLDGLDINVIGCACSEINLYEEDCVADRCEGTDYCANPISAKTLLDFPLMVRDTCYTDWSSGTPTIEIIESGTCNDHVVKISNHPDCDPCADADPLNDPDCDNDGVSDCFDACLGTPALESVNSNGCSCNQLFVLMGGFGSVACPLDGCIDADYYDYPDIISTTCLDGILTVGDISSCETLATVTVNALACDVCTDADPLNDPDTDFDGVTECGDDKCIPTPSTDTDGDGILDYLQINLFNASDAYGCSCSDLDTKGLINNYICPTECIGTTMVYYDNYIDLCTNGLIIINPKTCNDYITSTIAEHPDCCALVDSDNDGINDCDDYCDATPQTDTDGSGTADYLEVNTNALSTDYGCACSELTWSNTDCPGMDGCADADPLVYPTLTRVWYEYPDQIIASCNGGVISYSGTCDPTVNLSNSCTSEQTIDYDNFLIFSCESTVNCTYGYRCEGGSCVIDGVDLDGDGYYTTPYLFESGGITEIKEIDCLDSNPFINPGMTEIIYNGYDDDCDTLTSDADQDGDGYLAQIIVDPYFLGNDATYDCDDTDPTRTTDCHDLSRGICDDILGI